MHTKNNTPSIFVIFGATGDLAAKKILPSLWYLFRHGHLPERFSAIGFSRRGLSDDDFRGLVREAINKHGGVGADENAFARFLSLFSYQAGMFEDEPAFLALAHRITETEKSWGVCSNKLFYLAVPPSSYESIFKNFAIAKLNIPCGGELGWSRVLVEKPFGSDLASAQKLQTLLSSYFKEEQIYRIDHYLAKEIIQGIENFRFSNNLFENTWDNTTIERMDIRLLESIGAEGRGSFYDAVGALRDVGQNHLLMMLAAITLEYPSGMKADVIRKSRAGILETLAPWTDETVRKNTFRAQYRGYKNIAGVVPDSETETYFSLKTELTHPRWKGVPIFLEGGKRAAKEAEGEARKEIVLTLKHPAVCLLCEAGPHAPNRIVFRMEPNDEIIIHFWMKKPGFERVLEERTFSFFLYEKETKVQYVEEYGKLIHAAYAGNQALFVSNEEIEALWKFTDPVVSGWKHGLVPMAEYEPGATPVSEIESIVPDMTHAGEGSRAGQIGMVGLGKMGANLSRRLAEKGWSVIGYDHSEEAMKNLVAENIIKPAPSIGELVSALHGRRIIWLMIPAGKLVDDVLFGDGGLMQILSPGDVVIDGGNSHYKDSIRRAEELKKRNIQFLDVGVSGGPGGARRGASLMIGGDVVTFNELEPLFRAMALPGGYRFFLGFGAGHFVKMIHNGIEYSMMQSIAEGFDILKHSSYDLDISDVADIYNHGSVVESRLIGWLSEAFEMYGAELESVSGKVVASGEGAWTVETAKEMNIPVKVIEYALEFRKASEKNPSYAGKVLSALRNRFGGHSIDAVIKQ